MYQGTTDDCRDLSRYETLCLVFDKESMCYLVLLITKTNYLLLSVKKYEIYMRKTILNSCFFGCYILTSINRQGNLHPTSWQDLIGWKVPASGLVNYASMSSINL